MHGTFKLGLAKYAPRIVQLPLGKGTKVKLLKQRLDHHLLEAEVGVQGARMQADKQGTPKNKQINSTTNSIYSKSKTKGINVAITKYVKMELLLSY